MSADLPPVYLKDKALEGGLPVRKHLDKGIMRWYLDCFDLWISLFRL